MFRKFSISLVIFFIGASTAQACSVWYETREGEFEYDHLSPTIYDDNWSPYDDNALVGLAKGQSPFDHILQAENVYLAKAKLRKTPIKLPYFDKLPIKLVEFDVIETIQGKSKKSIWLSEDGKSLSVVLDTQELPKKKSMSLVRQTNERIKSHQNFAFWDTHIAPKSQTSHPTQATSCGSDQIPHVLNDTYYILFSRFDGSQRFIPVDGHHDPLVKTLRTAAKDKSHPHTKTRVRISMPVENYFRNVEWAHPVTLECQRSIISANRDNDWWDPFTAFSHEKKTFDDIGAVFKTLPGGSVDEPVEYLGEIKKPSQFDNLNSDWPSIFAFYPDRDERLLTCEGKESYLVYSYDGAEINSTDITNHTGDSLIQMPVYRFAKIIDGEILSASIQTNFALEGDDRIPLDTVMTWITEGSPEPIRNFVK